ncbi:ribosome biogenesis protein Nop16 [Phlebopus sp. FC_14]|nr:ribosome biogenesis protein Nop16 [Phlebopus sp. FC_14]
MANPRQRRKAKSHTHKAVSHSKRAKRLVKKMPAIRGPKVIQDAWDPTKTVRQNYVALGLEHDLNPIATGGSEADLKRRVDDNKVRERTKASHTPCEGREACQVPMGFGRIVRDARGAVIRVELEEAEEAGQDPQRADIDMKGPAADEEETRMWVEGCKNADSGQSVVKNLEAMAAETRAHGRHTSTGERAYLMRLVEKYGDDFERMARDRRLNVEQRTGGELRRAVSKAGVLAH